MASNAEQIARIEKLGQHQKKQPSLAIGKSTSKIIFG